MPHFPRCRVFLSLVPLALLARCRVAEAQIVTDGTLGPGRVLSGPDYQIGPDLGQVFGKNLFHSFQDFNLKNGQSATFSGPASIANILSRVTGGRLSSIDGSVNSTIAGANFFFLNPSGIVFGPNAQINVGGSFVATTANAIHLQNGGVFGDIGSSTLLSSAPPVSFGFLNAAPAPIVLNGSLLTVAPRQTLSLVGGDLRLQGAALQASSGKINLVSAGSAGQVALDASSAASTPVISGFKQLGSVMLNGALVDVGDDPFGASGGRGGSVSLSARNLAVDNGALIASKNIGTTSGGQIKVDLTGKMQVQNQSGIYVSNEGRGTGPDISIRAQEVQMTGLSTFDPHERTGIQSVVSDGGTGNGGHIQLQTEKLSLLNGALILTNSEGRGGGGDISVQAKDVLIDGQDSRDFTGLAAQTAARGQGGSIQLATKSLQIKSGGDISVSTFGSGAGGGINIQADDVKLDGQSSPYFTGIAAGTYADNGGQGGNVTVVAKNVEIARGAKISVDTQGAGNGGSIRVDADQVKMDGRGSEKESGIYAATLGYSGGGQGGDINVNANIIEVTGGSQINVDTEGSGNGGNIHIKAGTLELDRKGSQQSTGIIGQTLASSGGGHGGSIAVEAQSVHIVGGAQIAANAEGNGAGGDIHIKANKVVLDAAGSPERTGISASTSAEYPSSLGGRITIEGDDLQILRGASIAAFTLGGANGGNIVILSKNVTLNSQGTDRFTGISTQTAGSSAHAGKAGSITIKGKTLKILNGSEISSSSFGRGDGGKITVESDQVTLDGQGSPIFTGIAAATYSPAFGSPVRGGKGGSIDLSTQKLQILRGASVFASTNGTGKGGNIQIKAGSTLIDGQDMGTGIAAESLSTGEGGDGGSIKLETGDLQVLRGGLISVGTMGNGNSGDVAIVADTINLNRQGSPLKTGIAAETGSSGKGGSIGILTKVLNVSHGAEISANTLATGPGGSIRIRAKKILLDNADAPGFTGITAGTRSNENGGQGGNIRISADDLRIIHEALISASTLGSGAGGSILVQGKEITLDRGLITSEARSSGKAGSVTLKTSGSVDVGNDSGVFVTSAQSDGGDIVIETGKSLFVTDSNVNAQAARNGGSVKINSGDLILVQDGSLIARAGGDGGEVLSTAKYVIFDNGNILADAVQGKGGNILIQSRVFLPSTGSIIDASSQFGVDGNVAIDSPNTNIGGSLIILPSNLLSAESYLEPRCDARVKQADSSFSVNLQKPVPTQPGDLLPSSNP